MICFIDEFLDFQTYLTGYFIWKREKEKAKDNKWDHSFGILSWDKGKLNLPDMKAGEKLYIIAHLNETEKTLANGAEKGRSANDLGELLVTTLGLPKIGKIVLVACEAGCEDFSHPQGYPYARVLAEKIELDLKAKVPVTGYKGDVNVDDQTGKVIAYHGPESTSGAEGESGEDPAKEMEDWARSQKPSTPEELKKVVLSLAAQKTWLSAYGESLTDIRPTGLIGTARKAKFGI